MGSELLDSTSLAEAGKNELVANCDRFEQEETELL